jgi:hypothetical protein
MVAPVWDRASVPLSWLDRDHLGLARQMHTLSFVMHIPLVCFVMAFPAMVLFLEWLWPRTGDELYRALARRWSRVLVALFAMGVVTGTFGAVFVSVGAGLAALALVWARRFDTARPAAALAVAAIVFGWAVVQRPVLLPGLSVARAAAPPATLAALVVAVVAGGVLLVPGLGLLFRLVLDGEFDRPPRVSTPDGVGTAHPPPVGLRRVRWVAGAALVASFSLLNVADAGWAHGIGVLCLLAGVSLGFLAVDPAGVAAGSGDPQ